MFVLQFSHQELPGPHSSILAVVEKQVLTSQGANT